MFTSSYETGRGAGWALAVLLLLAMPAGAGDSAKGELPRVLESEQEHTVYDLSVHDPQTMQLLLKRLDRLALQPSPQSQSARIALVLHGPELNYFTIRNYAMHRELVDLAAKLDAFQVIEVKACQTKMRALGLEEADMPAFIDIVPYGPDEVRRLVGSGYLKM